MNKVRGNRSGHTTRGNENKMSQEWVRGKGGNRLKPAGEKKMSEKWGTGMVAMLAVEVEIAVVV